MLRNILTLIIIAAITVFGLNGCKKSPTKSKTTADYKAEAEEQISKENMLAELEKMEKAVDDEIGQEK